MADILYAEDEPVNRRLIHIHLKREGISCDLAQNAIEAWEMVQQNDYRLIILDLYMPGMNGDELARKIRQLKPDIPLIAITSDDSEISNLYDSGFAKVFIKPLRGREYISYIRELLD